MRDVSEFEQADSRDDSEGVFQKRQAAAQEEPGHQSPAGTPEAVAADQINRLVLPEARCPGQEQVSECRGGPHLDQLGPGPNLVERSPPAAVPPITTSKYEIPLPSVMQVKSARPKVAMSEVGAVGDGQDHRRDGHWHDLGVPRLVGEQADHDQAEHDQTAYRRDVPEIAGDPGFMPEDVVTGQQEQGRDQAEDANGTTCALAQ